MKNKLGILILLAVMAVMAGLCWNGINQPGLTSPEADSLNLHSVFSPQLIKCCCTSAQAQLETTRFLFLGTGLLALVLLFSITAKFGLRNMTSWVVLLAGTSIAWISSFQHISVLAFSIFSVLIVQWAFAFIYPKAEKSGF